MKTKSIHYIAGLTISIFIGLHLFNHIISIFGAKSHILLMDKLRLVYRNPILESVLLLAVLVQIISGINLFLRKRKTASNFFKKLQIWTGLYLAFFLVIHLGAVMMVRFILELDTNFYFGVAGLNTFPHNLFFIPYYGFAIFSFFGHIAAIHSKKMKRSLLGLEPDKQAYGVLLLGIVFTLITFYGLTNGFNGVAIPKAYDIIIGK